MKTDLTLLRSRLRKSQQESRLEGQNPTSRKTQVTGSQVNKTEETTQKQLPATPIIENSL